MECKTKILAFVMAFSFFIISATEADSTVPSSDSGAANATGTVNSAVVETDHGEGLGPNGVDLHVEVNTAADKEAELLKHSLEGSPALKPAPPIPLDADGADSQNGSKPEQPTAHRTR